MMGDSGGSPNMTKKTKEKSKIGHRRINNEGTVTYKKKTTSEIQCAIQMGIQISVSIAHQSVKRDMLLKDFGVVETMAFPKAGGKNTPAHDLSDFKFKTFAPIAFRYFRDFFQVDVDEYLNSICQQELKELSNAGASGSIFYITYDDEFIIKTVQHKEANFLQKLLPEYYINLIQHPRTLLPKFYGLYCYQTMGKNIRFVVMNNLLPSIAIHEKYDLKGSTYKRIASGAEIAKSSPTLKDLDFRENHSEGLFLEVETYDALFNTIQRDCRVLESFSIMDYSLLLGIHNLDKSRNIKIKKDEPSALNVSKTNEKTNSPKKSPIQKMCVCTNKPDFEGSLSSSTKPNLNEYRLIYKESQDDSNEADDIKDEIINSDDRVKNLNYFKLNPKGNKQISKDVIDNMANLPTDSVQIIVADTEPGTSTITSKVNSSIGPDQFSTSKHNSSYSSSDRYHTPMANTNVNSQQNQSNVTNQKKEPFNRSDPRFRSNKRIAAWSTVLESIQANFEWADLDASEQIKETIPSGGIPARNKVGDRLILFMGIIDILQSYQLGKKMEHNVKAIFLDPESISVCNPTFYAQRFQDFFSNQVFKKIPSLDQPQILGPSARRFRNFVHLAMKHHPCRAKELSFVAKIDSHNSNAKVIKQDTKHSLSHNKNLGKHVTMQVDSSIISDINTNNDNTNESKNNDEASVSGVVDTNASEKNINHKEEDS